MAKFKAGDRVRCITKNWGNCYYEPDKIYTVKRVRYDGHIVTDADGAGNGENGWDDYNFELVSQSPIRSPIREVTKREIVPGWYAGIFVQPPDKGTVRLFVNTRTFKPTELRAAAKLFNEIADVLDENSANTMVAG